MQKLGYVALTSAILMHTTAFANCDAKASGSASYSKAKVIVYSVPEVKAWRKLVYAVGRKVITIPSMDHQILINGKCYWSVNLFEDTPDHAIRFNGFYVQINSNNVLVDDVMSGNPITLKQWRAQIEQGFK